MAPGRFRGAAAAAALGVWLSCTGCSGPASTQMSPSDGNTDGPPAPEAGSAPDRPGQQESVQGVRKIDQHPALQAFADVCLSSELDFREISRKLAQGGWRRQPAQDADRFLRGILPAERSIFRHADADHDVFLIVAASGEITREQRQRHAAGFPAETEPIVAGRILADILGTRPENMIGTKSCRIISYTEDAPRLLRGLSKIRYRDKEIGTTDRINKLSDSSGEDSNAGINYGWYLESGKVVFNFGIEGGDSKRGRRVSMMMGLAVFLHDAPETYRLIQE